MGSVQLPDCTDSFDPGLLLSADEKRELVLRIAQEGPDALDAYVREKEAEGDSLIAQKIRRLRDELLRRAEELKERLQGEYALKRDALQEEWDAAYADLQTREQEARERLDRLHAEEETLLQRALRERGGIANVVLTTHPGKPSWRARLRRAWRTILRILLWPVRMLLLLFEKLTGRGGDAERRDRKEIQFSVPLPGRLGVEMGSRLGAALDADPSLRRRVKDRLRAAPPKERARRVWNRLLGREDYETLMQNALARMLEEEARESREEIDARERALKEDLQQALDREEARRREHERALERLDEDREREAERIERMLEEGPERDVREEILDQLQASGLLRERDGALLPTLQFLDTFAAHVYDEETRNLRGGQSGDAGDFAEAVGTFQRGPMRHHLELAHADFVASKIRARSRHPRIRRILEEDVLVYREEREALQHVVLIFDRSGSMEENQRLEAAKRATLALYHAVLQENPRNRVDVIMMDTGVERVDLHGVWAAEPRGFTNTAGALKLAARLLEEEQSERALVYLVTDGLPEAYTVDGEDVAGHPEKAREHARREAKRLAEVRGLGGFVVLLLEPEEDLFVEAAEELADVMGGRVVPVQPDELAGALIRSFERDGAQARAPAR